MLPPKELQTKLKCFHSPEKHSNLRDGYGMSEGVQFLIDQTYAEWLLGKVLKWLRQSQDLRQQRFQIFVLKVDLTSRTAVLEVQNEAREILRKERIRRTNFPLDYTSIWVKDRLLMLPTEFAHSF